MDQVQQEFQKRFNILRGSMNSIQVAEICSISREMVSSYSEGRSTPNLSDLVAIAKGFGVSTDYLVGNTNYRDPSKMNRTKYSWR